MNTDYSTDLYNILSTLENIRKLLDRMLDQEKDNKRELERIQGEIKDLRLELKKGRY